MRIWHEQLISKLCRQHLLAMWREGLGAYAIITENKKGYRNHPAVKEFENNPHRLWERLANVRNEMIKRKYHPKNLPDPIIPTYNNIGLVEPWQTLSEQIQILKAKNCKCNI
jgi:uncharacterized protein (TIGR02328 family)